MRRRVGSLLLTIGLLVSAWPALAAEVIDVRVGKHPEFTRVVFELDRAAGYRIERSDSSRTASELVVSLEAYSSAERIRSSKSLIKQVDVEPAGSRSIVRVSLAQRDLRLKEMILNNPPRIVIDILKPADSSAMRSANATSAKSKAMQTAAAAKAAAESKAKAAKAAADAKMEKAKAAEIAAAKAAEAATAKAAAAQKKVKGSITVAKASVADSAANAKNKLQEAGGNISNAVAEASDSAKTAASATADSAKEAAGKLATNMAGGMAGDIAGKAKDASDAVKNAGQDAGQTARKSVESLFGDDPQVAKANTAAVQKPVTQKAAPRPKPMVAKSDSSEGGWLTWALAGAGLLAVVGGGLLVARRRAGGEVDFADEYDDESDDVFGDADGQAEESNLFAGFGADADNQVDETGEQTTVGESTAAAALIADDEVPTAVASDSDDEKESESIVFEDSVENDMDDMEVISREQVNESLGGTMPPAMGEVPAEFQQMVMEMSRRMEALEGRCDELVDARDRLERQVAAQTEELRVQRAAIARTQRAVRNLGRSDEDEHEPTEPALRDPNQPSSD